MGALSDRQMAFFAAKGLTLQDAIEFAQLSDSVEASTLVSKPVDEAAERRRAWDRERQAAKRAANKAAQKSTVCPPDFRMASPPDKGSASSPNDSKTLTPSITSKSNSGADAKSILTEVVSIETAAEIIAHRKAIRSPLTTGAAKGLAKNLAASGDAEKAAASMMANGWRGYKPEWDRPSPRAGPPVAVKRNPHIAAFERDMGYARPDDHHGPTIDCRASADDGKRSLQSDWLAQEQDRARQDRRAMLVDERNAERRLENQDRR